MSSQSANITLGATGGAWGLQAAAGGPVRQLESADDDSRGSDEPPESAGPSAAAAPSSPGLAL